MKTKHQQQYNGLVWKQSSISEIAEVQTGPFGSQLHEHDYVKRGTPIITVENLENGLIKLTTNTPRVNEVDVERLKKYSLKEGDIVFSRVGSVDRSALVTKDQEGWMFSGRILRVRAKRGINSKFLNYYLSKQSVKNTIRNLAVGGTMPSLNTAIFNYVPVYIMPEDEQSRIVAVLETWDKAIELLTKKIEIKKKIRKSIIQDLLSGKKRLTSYVSPWSTKKLHEIGVFSKGSGILKDQITQTGFNAIRYGEIYTKYSIYITRVYSKIPTNVIPNTRKIKYGDVLFTGSGETIDEIGKSSAYLMEEDCYAGGDIIVFSPKDNDSVFLSYLFNSSLIRKELRELGQGQSVVHLYASDLANMTITIPAYEEQKDLANIFLIYDKEIEALEKKLSLLTEQKKFLLNKLITGEILTPENLLEETSNKGGDNLSPHLN